jgi:cysteinyl-tRNA synthetase
VLEPLLDDLNTSLAIAALHGLRNSDVSALAGSLRLLGFFSESAAQWEGRKQLASGVDASEIDRLIADRAAARARKDFRESDRIRDELIAKGVVLKDGKDAAGKPVTTWELA